MLHWPSQFVPVAQRGKVAHKIFDACFVFAPMAMLRRFTLANPYELNLPPRLSLDSQHGDQQLQIPYVRDRTFSDSVVPPPGRSLLICIL